MADVQAIFFNRDVKKICGISRGRYQTLTNTISPSICKSVRQGFHHIYNKNDIFLFVLGNHMYNYGGFQSYMAKQFIRAAREVGDLENADWIIYAFENGEVLYCKLDVVITDFSIDAPNYFAVNLKEIPREVKSPIQSYPHIWKGQSDTFVERIRKVNG